MSPSKPRPALPALLAALARGELTSETLTRDCLARIAEREPVVRAWAHLDAGHALAQAHALDQSASRGPVHGLPVAVKDVFDTFDAPSAYGSPIYAGQRPACDAAVVARMRGVGALMLGKTVTTEFATFTPNVTTNPHNPGHTPGGSSSGSAAAVADGMVPVAFGTQTIGSIIRPAAYCGVAGYKPTFGLLPRTGVKAISDCLDTVGCFAPSVADVACFAGLLAGRPLAVPAVVTGPAIGLCLTPQWQQALPETQALFAGLGAALERAGARVKDFSLPTFYEGLNAAQDTIAAVEMAACLADEHRRFAHLMSQRLRLRLDEGVDIPVADYDAAMALARQGRQAFADAIRAFDVLVVPSAMGEAPAGLEATGDPVFNRMWSLLHTPCVHVPISRGPRGLPVGLQVVGRLGDDARALACAHWIESHLREQ